MANKKKATYELAAAYSVNEVMGILERSRNTIAALIKAGDLRAIRTGRTYIISGHAIARFLHVD